MYTDGTMKGNSIDVQIQIPLNGKSKGRTRIRRKQGKTSVCFVEGERKTLDGLIVRRGARYKNQYWHKALEE